MVERRDPDTITWDSAWLWREYDAGRRANERRLALYEQLRREFATPGWDSETERAAMDSDYAPENMSYAYVSQLIPQLIYGKPRIRMRSRRTDPRDPLHLEVKAGEHAVNQWVLDSDFKRVQETMAADPLFAFACALVTETRNPYAYRSTDEQEGWPSVQRISPRNSLRDPMALTREECEWYAHRWVQRKEKLLETARENPDDGWDLEAVRALCGQDTTGTYRADRGDAESGIDRNEVMLCEMWWPGYTIERGNPWKAEPSKGEKHGHFGTLFTIAVAREGSRGESRAKSGAVFIRKPRPYYGYREGPYAFAEVSRVPDDPYGLAPLVATYGQQRDLNDVARAISKSLTQYKRLTAVNTAMAPGLDEKIKSGEFDSIIPIAETGGMRMSDLVAPIEAGGMPLEALRYMDIALARYFRMQGMGEAQTGNADPDATATAVAVANQESGIRKERVKEEWARFNEDILKRVAFYTMTGDSVRIALGAEAAEDMPIMAALGLDGYQGGGVKPDEFDGLQIDLDVTSMERVTEQAVQQRHMQAFTIKQAALPLIVQFPVPEFWVKEFEALGDALNIPNYGESIGVFIQGLTQLPQTAMHPANVQHPSVSVNVGGQQKQGGQARQSKPILGPQAGGQSASPFGGGSSGAPKQPKTPKPAGAAA